MDQKLEAILLNGKIPNMSGHPVTPKRVTNMIAECTAEK